MNHDNNTATASARLDIAYGDIKVTPGTVTTTVSYGSKPYAATPAAGISATNRLSILGTATPDNGKNFQILVNNGGSGTAAERKYPSLRAKSRRTGERRYRYSP